MAACAHASQSFVRAAYSIQSPDGSSESLPVRQGFQKGQQLRISANQQV